MLLSHTVLAVVLGGLLASAYPEPGRSYSQYEEYDSETPTAYAREDILGNRRTGAWQWVPDAPQPQRVMSATWPPSQVDWEDHDHPRPSHFPDIPRPPVDIPDKPEYPPHPPHPPEHPPFPWPHPPEGEPGHFPPHTPPGAPNAPEQQTIYEFLRTSPEFSRIFKVVNFTEDITKLLNDSSANLTFFALPDWAIRRLRRGRHRGPHGHGPHHDVSESDFEDSVEGQFLQAQAAADYLVLSPDGKDDDDDKKKWLKAVLTAVLKYETLPTALPSSELSKNVTFATSLTLPDGSLDGEPLRIRVGLGSGVFHPRLNVNVWSEIVKADIKTKNGVIHVVNRPVVPPPSTFQIGFLLPEIFSTLTSALQRVGLTHDVEWHDVPGSDGKHTVEGSPAVTVFAPTNKAFAKLPRDLRVFLFSPFGEKALKKILQFHVVPELVLHADYLHNASDAESGLRRAAREVPAEFDLYDSLVPSDEYSAIIDDIKPAHPYRGARGAASAAQDDQPDPSHWYQAPYHGAEGAYPRTTGHWPCEGPRCPLASPPHYPPYAEPPARFPPPPFRNAPCECVTGPPPPQGPAEHGARCHPSPPPPHYPPFEYGPRFPPPPPRRNPLEHGCGYQLPPPPFEQPHCLHCPSLRYHPAGHCSPPPFPPVHFPEHGAPPASPRYPAFEPCSGAPYNHHHHPIPGRPKLVYRRNITVPTLLANHSLNVHVVQHELNALPIPGHSRKFYHTLTLANGRRVAVSDIATRNGVLHVVDRLLNPLKESRGPRHGHGAPGHGAEPEFRLFAGYDGEELEEDEWAGWQEWLPRWADEE